MGKVIPFQRDNNGEDELTPIARELRTLEGPEWSRQIQYVNAVKLALEEGTEFQWVQRCHDCDETLMSMGETLDLHMIGEYQLGFQRLEFVIIGCEGYWHVNPRVLGIDPGDGWSSIEDVNDDM